MNIEVTGVYYISCTRDPSLYFLSLYIAFIVSFRKFLSFSKLYFQFEQGDVYNRETMLKKLKGCDSWLCFNCNPSKIKQQAEVF